MSETDGPFKLPEESPDGGNRSVKIIAATVFALMALAAAWIVYQKPQRQAHETAIAVLEKELDGDQAALQLQKEKIVDLTRQLDALKLSIQTGQAADGKKAVTEYHQLVQLQHAERDKFTTMATVYNQKVAQLRQLQQ